MIRRYSIIKMLFLSPAILLLNSCASIPKDVRAVQNFNKDRYLGQWYEIARFDYVFEKDMNNTTANYSLNADGSIKVLNKGYKFKKNKWATAEGKAKFVGRSDQGRLKVSFFRPFYGAYNVVWIDDKYENAMIYGGSTKYIWILSRNR